MRLCAPLSMIPALNNHLTLRSAVVMRRGVRGTGITVDPARVREARRNAGLSLARLAADDVSRTFLHFVEQGKARPSAEVLALIARRTGRPTSYFVVAPTQRTPQSVDIASELVSVASRLRRMISQKRLGKVDYEAIKLVELSIRQGSQLVRAIEDSSSRRPRRKKDDLAATGTKKAI